MSGRKKQKPEAVPRPEPDAPAPPGEEIARIDAQDLDVVEQQEGPLEPRTSVEKINRMKSSRDATEPPGLPGA
jgi:hypothetical protein